MAGSFFSYVKAAFKNQWNLLAVGAGTIFAFLTGKPDIALPILTAVELAYLATTAGHPRFQHFVDKVKDKIEAKETNLATTQRLAQLYDGLDDASKAVWDDLRKRCDALGDGEGGTLDALASEQLANVNKLLWVHLRLLHTRMKLAKFLASTDGREMDRSELDSKRRLDAIPADTTDPVAAKKRKSLEDTLATLAVRKANLKRAKENYELVELELARISTKLAGVIELAQNRQDPGTLTQEVDEAARSVASTEQMMGELQSFTGLTPEDIEAPQILGPLSVAQKAALAGRVRAG